MTREAFIEELDDNGYYYKIEGDKIVVTHKGNAFLNSLTSISPGVVFNNEGGVFLKSLKSLPHDMGFNNRGDIHLDSLTSLPPGVVFNNRDDIFLPFLTSLPPGVEFRNFGYVKLISLMGGYFDDWKGNIEGVDSKRLLNKMISLGIFER